MIQSHKMHDAIPTLKKIDALRECCAKCYFCQGGLKLLLTTVYIYICICIYMCECVCMCVCMYVCQNVPQISKPLDPMLNV